MLFYVVTFCFKTFKTALDKFGMTVSFIGYNVKKQRPICLKFLAIPPNKTILNISKNLSINCLVSFLR